MKTLGSTTVYLLILIWSLETTMEIMKGFLYVIVLLATSLYDRKNKIIPDSVHPILILLGIIHCHWGLSIVGMITLPIPFIIVALVDGNSMGGGDIKYMASNGFFLGIKGGIIAAIIGLILVIICNLKYVNQVNTGIKHSVALAPYLSIGCLFSYLIYIAT